MKIAYFSDSHIGFGKALDQNLRMFEENLLLARNLGADLIIHTGDLFESKQINHKWIYQANQLLNKYKVRQLCENEVIFGKEDQIAQINSDNSIPMIIICGNHESIDILNLVNCSKVEFLVDNVYYPFILSIKNQTLIIYGIDYYKLINEKLNTGERKLVIPDKFVQEHNIQNVKSILLSHVDNSDVTSRFNFKFLHDFNRQSKYPIQLVLNGHEHDYSLNFLYANQEIQHQLLDELEVKQELLKINVPVDVQILQPGSCVETKHEKELEKALNLEKRHFILLSGFELQNIQYNCYRLMNQHIVGKRTVTIGCRELSKSNFQEKYCIAVRHEVETTLNLIIEKQLFIFGNVKELFACSLFGYENVNSFYNDFKKAVSSKDFIKIFGTFIPKPNVQFILKPHDYVDYVDQLLQVDLEGALDDLKQFFSFDKDSQQLLIAKHVIDINIKQQDFELNEEKQEQELILVNQISDFRFEHLQVLQSLNESLIAINNCEQTIPVPELITQYSSYISKQSELLLNQAFVDPTKDFNQLLDQMEKEMQFLCKEKAEKDSVKAQEKRSKKKTK